MREFKKISRGKYKGKSIPWLFFHDTEYLFHLINNHQDCSKELLEDLKYVSLRIQCINVSRKGKEVKFAHDDNGCIKTLHTRCCFFEYEYDTGIYHPNIDFSIPLKKGIYDKHTYSGIIKKLKLIFYKSSSYRMTDKRCQEFFRDRNHFDIDCSLAENKVLIQTTPKKEPDTELKVQVQIPSIIFETIDAHFQNKTARRRAKAVITFIFQSHQLKNAPIIKFMGYPENIKKLLLTSRFYSVWEKLVDLGILQLYSDKHGIEFHWKKGIPKRYRINPTMIESPYVVLEVEIDRRHFTVEDIPVVQYTASSIKKLAVHMPLESRLKELAVTIWKKLKVRATLQYITEENILKANCNLKESQTRIKSQYIPQVKNFDTQNRVTGMINKLKLIDNKITFASRSELNGRLSHNLTNLDKVLLPLLLLDGDKIVEFDLSNSQPLILAYVLDNIINDVSHPILNDPLLHEYIYPDISHKSHSKLLTSHFEDDQLELLKDEICTFKEWCSAGLFYDNLIGHYKQLGITVKRNEIKIGFTKVMFGKYNHSGKQKDLIAGKFPTIILLLDGFKQAVYRYYQEAIHLHNTVHKSLRKYLHSKSQGAKSPYDAGNDYLAIRLQEIESKIFIDHILTGLYKEGLTVFSRHDSICCKESDQEMVFRIIQEKLGKIFGMKGYQLKGEIWN